LALINIGVTALSVPAMITTLPATLVALLTLTKRRRLILKTIAHPATSGTARFAPKNRQSPVIPRLRSAAAVRLLPILSPVMAAMTGRAETMVMAAMAAVVRAAMALVVTVPVVMALAAMAPVATALAVTVPAMVTVRMMRKSPIQVWAGSPAIRPLAARVTPSSAPFSASRKSNFAPGIIRSRRQILSKPSRALHIN